MLNFLHWLALHHPEARKLRSLPRENLLTLVNEFENGKLGHNSQLREKWRAGFQFLFEGTSDWEGYDQARRLLGRERQI